MGGRRALREVFGDVTYGVANHDRGCVLDDLNGSGGEDHRWPVSRRLLQWVDAPKSRPSR